MIPEPYQFVLLCLAAYRLWRLLAEDDILNRPRRWLVRLPSTWKEGDSFPSKYRKEYALFLNCPWCAGAWISLLTYIGWIAVLGDWPDTAGDVFVGLGVWFGISCVLGLIRRNLDPPEE